MKAPISLQSRLIQHAMFSSILAGFLAWLLLLGISSYQAIDLHDDLMEEISELLLGDVNQAKNTQVDEISEQFDIQYALLLNQQVLTTSIDDELINEIPLAQKNGFHFDYENGHFIRILIAEDQDLKVKVVQPLSVRFDELWQTTLGFAGILFILWILQWLILRFAIKRQLRPLNKISREIGSKSAQDLTPVQSPDPEITELQPIVRQLNAMLSRLEKSLAAEQRFTADASHELRSPLSAIQMRLQVLKRKYQEDAQLRQALQMIQNDVNRGTQILENLLLLARLDPEHAEQLPKQQVNLKVLVQEVLQALQPFAQEKEIHWNLKLEDAVIEANAELIFSCIRNLVDNAIRYTPMQGQVEIRTIVEGQNLQLMIENSGEGIQEEVVQRLGERFYRALGTRTQGSGLGLSICQKIMQLHTAKIDYAPSVLGGLKVSLIIFQSEE
ncbi:two-component sensor histidine kinase [Acinetobacter sp. GFQ9D192M]|uniref:sensor histidine kinase n=1 Tax=unclassified Acinetobacter TaxID=196816 RepID=UPI00140D525D|nr:MULTISPECIES: ATP-binding protein [unclassified Acinetobacter]NHB64403.1 two-component sensor histidine kinase [Acinetobacter sp. GFQ9D191M]NHB99782.1 two-component sensor histidine kinase [Acinetobacter sp. GFQ9D192M]